MPFLKNMLKHVKRPEIDFPSLRLTRKPNQFLMAPEGLCSGRVHAKSPVFTLPVHELRAKLEALALATENLEKLSDRDLGEGRSQSEFVKYSNLVGYPDTITIEYLELKDGNSTLAVYSRAHYGYRDFGVNARRILRWMAELKEYIMDPV